MASFANANKLRNHGMLIYDFAGFRNDFSRRWPLALARFCVTFCPLFLQLQLLASVALTGHRLPPCRLLVSRRITPVSPLFKLNAMFHLQRISGICFLPGEREREREDIRHQASGVPVAEKQLALKSKVDRRRKFSFVHLDFYRLLFSAAFVGRHSGCGGAECPF